MSINTVTTDAGPYGDVFTFTADADTDTITVTAKLVSAGSGARYDGLTYPTSEYRPGFLNLWFDGQFLGRSNGSDGPDYGFAFSSDGTGWDGGGVGTTYTITQDRSVRDWPPGEYRVQVAVRPINEYPIFPAWAEVPVTLPPRPAPKMYPTKIPRCLFFLTKAECDATPGLLAAAQAAGVNTIQGGLFPNPGDSFGPTDQAGVIAFASTYTYAAWQPAWDAFMQPQIDHARDNDMLLVFTGDDLYRNINEKAFLENWPALPQAITHMATYLAANDDVVCGIELMDEMLDSSVGPGYPIPPAEHWFYTNFMQPWRAVPNATPLSSPGTPGVDEDGLRRGNYWEDRSDYYSRYIREYSVVGQIPGSVYRGLSYAALAGNARECWRDTNKVKPLSCEFGAIAYNYSKRTDPDADQYVVGDWLFSRGNRPNDYPMTMWLGIIMGGRHFRGYYYDYANQRAYRGASALHTDPANYFSQGISPDLTPDRWAGLSAAYNSVGSRESIILAGHVYPLYERPPWIYGRIGDLKVAINISENPQYCRSIVSGVVVTGIGERRHSRSRSVPAGGVVLSQ